MVQEAETSVIELDLVSCGSCDLVFISSERRETCPTCGGEAVGPYLEFVVTPEGPRLKNGAVAVARAASAEEPPGQAGYEESADEALADSEIPSSEGPTDPIDAFTPLATEFLRRGEISEAELSEQLQGLGADPETAAATVGRLTAIRETVEWLRPAGAEAQEEAAAEEPAAPAGEPAEGEPASE